MNKIIKFTAVLMLIVIFTLSILTVVQVFQQKFNNPYIPKVVMIHSKLSPFVKEYRDILLSNQVLVPWGKDLVIIDFSSAMPDFVLGVAWGMNIDNVTVVSINYKSWNFLSYQQKRYLIFHEISHDVFNFEHFETPLMNTPMPDFVSKYKVDKDMRELIKYLKK